MMVTFFYIGVYFSRKVSNLETNSRKEHGLPNQRDIKNEFKG